MRTSLTLLLAFLLCGCNSVRHRGDAKLIQPGVATQLASFGGAFPYGIEFPPVPLVSGEAVFKATDFPPMRYAHYHLRMTVPRADPGPHFLPSALATAPFAASRVQLSFVSRGGKLLYRVEAHLGSLNWSIVKRHDRRVNLIASVADSTIAKYLRHQPGLVFAPGNNFDALEVAGDFDLHIKVLKPSRRAGDMVQVVGTGS